MELGDALVDPITAATDAMKLVEEGGGLGAVVPAEQDTDMIDRDKHPSGIVPVLQNVVATVNLGCSLDLKEIALHARNAEYNPKRFAAVIMRIREPKTTALIFASGKMVCTGAKSEHDSKLAARKYCRIVQKLGFDAAEFKEFKIQNIVGSCDVKFPIRLEGLAYSHGYFATYEPELFPGLIYRMKQPKIVLLIFVSGKVVLTGAKKRDEIYEAFENIFPTLQEFKKRDTAAGIETLAAQMLPPPNQVPAITAGPSAAGPSNANGAGPSNANGAGPSNGNGAGPSNAPRRAGSMLPPPDLPPPTPAYFPPATPHHMPAATPAFIPPATPHHVPQELGPPQNSMMPPPRVPPATPRHPTQ